MHFRRVIRFFIILMIFAFLGYCLYEFVSPRIRFCAVVTHPAVAVGFMMFVGWLVFLGFDGEKKKP